MTGTVPRTRISGATLPGYEPGAGDGRWTPPHEIALPHPAIEELPSFVRRIDSQDLAFGLRHYNGSLALHDGRIFMAYRVESFRSVSRVGVCELDHSFNVIRDQLLEPGLDNPETHIEDPHLATAGGRLVVIVSNVVRSFPVVCRQRILELDPASLTILEEIPATFGNIRGVEKNWTPFELPDSTLGFVYKQRPRTVIQVATGQGWTVPELPVGPANSSLSGRTGPVRITPDLYLEFVGGHIPLPGRGTRGTRYWFGALAFEARTPHKVVGTTGTDPLVWASEASPTIFNHTPAGGHPVCIMPAGCFVRSGVAFVACGVNDSYNVILRFEVADLLKRMGL